MHYPFLITLRSNSVENRKLETAEKGVGVAGDPAEGCHAAPARRLSVAHRLRSRVNPAESARPHSVPFRGLIEISATIDRRAGAGGLPRRDKYFASPRKKPPSL